jgi:GST-like protein
MALYPWVARHQWHRIELAEFEHIERWYRALGQREAVRRGMAVPA